jgi:hypothetical protein
MGGQVSELTEGAQRQEVACGSPPSLLPAAVQRRTLRVSGNFRSGA